VAGLSSYVSVFKPLDSFSSARSVHRWTEHNTILRRYGVVTVQALGGASWSGRVTSLDAVVTLSEQRGTIGQQTEVGFMVGRFGGPSEFAQADLVALESRRGRWRATPTGTPPTVALAR
jgi:hypothetical protein